MQERIRPLRDHLLVRKNDFETQSRGGILLPDMAQERPRQGVVLAVGPGKTMDDGRMVPLAVDVGDRVLFTTFAGNQVGDDELLAMLSESDVLAILE